MVSVKQIVVGGLVALGLAGIVGGAGGYWHFRDKVHSSSPAVVRAYDLDLRIRDLESRYRQAKAIESNSPGSLVTLFEEPQGYRRVPPQEFYEFFQRKYPQLKEQLDSLLASQPSLADGVRQHQDNMLAGALMPVAVIPAGMWLLYGAWGAAMLMEGKKD